ncbi:uncharacterized protein LOC119647436 [Hermetia illucens]|uniref:uncharacterized protein LOC119647436 n=1 Tax=Hermetia illucens TaxID=343691 RepID=UPI0018CC0872|nr:uncharacterized protein LOC119647436 [Hermetia illucens]
MSAKLHEHIEFSPKLFKWCWQLVSRQVDIRQFVVQMTNCNVIGSLGLFLNCSMNHDQKPASINALGIAHRNLGIIFINIQLIAFRKYVPNLVLLNRTGYNVTDAYYRPPGRKADIVKILIDDMTQWLEVNGTAMHLRNYHPDENRLPGYLPDVKFRLSYDIFGSLISNRTRMGFATFEGVVKYLRKLG